MRTYTGKNLDLVSFPMGGIGAGMVCLQGNGSLGSVSLRHRPDVRREPMAFSAVTILGKEPASRIVEAPVPGPNFFIKWENAGNGLPGKNYGLPRFPRGEFSARFPFATLKLTDDTMPLAVEIVGWSPFVPGDEDASSLPFAALEYKFTNTGKESLEAVYYFCAENFMRTGNSGGKVRAVPDGFVLEQPAAADAPHEKGAFCASVDEKAHVNAAWFRGGWFDTLTMLWTDIQNGVCGDRKYSDPENGGSAGGTLAVPFTLAPGTSRTIRLHFSWYVPESDLRTGGDDACCGEGCCCGAEPKTYRPWYASRFGSVDEANNAWFDEYESLRRRTRAFTDCFFDSTLPDEILDAVSANLSILKSPTVLRQADGRLWGWEGCHDGKGCCDGSCTHVWNYAQAIASLFPRLERSLRETEFNEAQDDAGHQTFRAWLPVRETADHSFHAASDGQLGGIIKVYRDWRITGDTAWLKSMWPRMKASLDFCIRQWDPEHEGILKQPHHNTYDIEFWGPDGMCTSFYLGALTAFAEMGRALGIDCAEYTKLYERGRAYLEANLFNGEYFFQRVMWKELRQKLDLDASNDETRALLEREGPKYQYGTGCLSDGILGVWLAELNGFEDILDENKVKKNLESIYRYNFKRDLSAHSNPQRPGYAAGHDAGLLLCTWPHGGKPSLPFVYSDEVWTGIEYQAASHMILKGFVKEGLEIVRGCRARYDGTVRNPYNEYECGHWYARAMASYALLQAYTGVRYDSVTKTLYAFGGRGDFRTFLSTASGYGTVEYQNGKLDVKIIEGKIEIKETALI